MGGSKQTSTSTSYSGSGQQWAQPIAQGAVQQVQGVYNANAPGLQSLTNQVQALVPKLGGMIGTNPNVKAAQGYNSDILSGKYLNGNPYLTSIIDQTRRSVTDGVNSQFSLGGRYGSGAHEGMLAQKLADAEGNLRYQDYTGQQARMDQAAQQAPALAQSDLIGLPELLQAATLGGSLPYQGANNYASALGALFNGGASTGTSETKQSGLGGIMQGIGSMASAAAMFSDRRLKRDIEKVGELPDGLGVYTFRYNDVLPDLPEGTFRGVMADEVARLRPWALGPEREGYMTVNYAALEDA